MKSASWFAAAVVLSFFVTSIAQGAPLPQEALVELHDGAATLDEAQPGRVTRVPRIHQPGRQAEEEARVGASAR